MSKRGTKKKQTGDGAPVCPVCSKTMVERSGEYGTFWGCAGFPDCRGTRNADSSITATSERLIEAKKQEAELTAKMNKPKPKPKYMKTDFKPTVKEKPTHKVIINPMVDE